LRAADFNNAGHLDLYLGNMPGPKNNHTGCVMLRNNGDGNFTASEVDMARTSPLN
jgi:hypothetical protein